MTEILDLALGVLPKPIHVHVEHDLGGVKLHFTLSTPAAVRSWATALGDVLTTQPTTGPIVRDGHTEYRFTTAVVERPGLTIRVGACELALKTDDPLPPLVNGTYFADDAPDPDLARADAVWHREHPADCCPNAATCTECRTGVA